jgi:hypothetical protein
MIHFKRPRFLIPLIILLIAIIALVVSRPIRTFVSAAVGFILYGITSAHDVNEAAGIKTAITNAVTAIHHFDRNSAIQPDKPPISVIPGSRLILRQPPIITIYEISNRPEQDKVIAAIESVMRERKFNPIDVRFMDHENWISSENWGERGPELQLRRVRISQNCIREQGGKQMITYSIDI